MPNQRTNPKLVAERLNSGGNYDGSTSLAHPIAMAYSLVSRVIEKAAGDDITISTEDAKLLETELAAHFHCISDRVYMSRSTLGASGSFGGVLGKGLEFTPYGQAALAFDPSQGWLKALTAVDGSGVVGVTWLGKPQSEQLTWEERN